MKSRWNEGEARAAVDRYAAAGVNEDLARHLQRQAVGG